VKAVAAVAVLCLLLSSRGASQDLPQPTTTSNSAEQSQEPEPSTPQSIQTQAEDGTSSVTIPRLPGVPNIDNFLTMQPEGYVAQKMAKVSGFIQREPHDDTPPTHATDVYLGYDRKNFYAVFVCHDDPKLVRARPARREDVFDDDTVGLMIDTFRDRRRAYEFVSNPLGAQWDAIWTEQAYEETNGNYDESWDALWYSKGKVTSGGFVILMAIPFRSLRFPPKPNQTWGLILIRMVVRDQEKSFWPRVTIRKEGRLAQAATANGLEHISPGRNIQLIPYGLLNSFRSLDTRDPNFARFENRDIGGTFGLDAKVILKDSLVLDATANPDFSQVESDDAQVTVNQRFEVFFPEKRPFFLENADYFRTPINLFFSRRIVNPSGGLRLTGKVGPYSLGLLSTDDRAPGLTVAAGDPLFKTRSYFNVGRVSRDVFNQSTVGAIFTDWEYPAANSFNRVGGIDSRLKFNTNWTSKLQAVVSSTQDQLGGYSAGSAYTGDIAFSGKHFEHAVGYTDFSPGFVAQTGFVNRVDIRTLADSWNYRFRPKSGPVIAWGPLFIGNWTWDHTGLRLDTNYYSEFGIYLKKNSRILIVPYNPLRERLRPKDYPGVLTENRDYHEHNSGVNFQTTPVSQITIGAQYFFGDSVNFFPSTTGGPPCDKPCLARWNFGQAQIILHPFSALKIENDYLFTRLRTRETNAAIFNNHVIRTKWNWQFNKELSLRAILQYNATLANQAYTSLPTSKNLNADVLVTYLLHPGTAVYVGYNSDFQTAAIDPNTHLLQPTNRLTNDGRLFFVKVSYLLRF
jgi:hypothetical protein